MNAITPIEWRELDDSKVRQLADSGICLPWRKQILHRDGQQFTILMGLLELCPGLNGVRFFVADLEGHLLTDAAVRDYQSALTRSSVELSLSAERERREIAEELHDSVGQELAIAKLRLSKLREETGGVMRAELDAIAAQISSALVSCRTLSHTLAVPALYELGLIPALKNLIATLNQDDRFHIASFFTEEDLPLGEVARIIVYRVIRELMINVVKHSRAASVDVVVTREEASLKVVITDDGVGFDTGMSQPGAAVDSGFGLFLVRQRLRHLGGSFELDSTPGRGTTVTVVAPLDDTAVSAGPAS
jgi:signal transduction histidine kinase